VVYPFSGRYTTHQVALAGGPTVPAICAVDALSIPQMPGRDGLITELSRLDYSKG
jgi:hypothetical protein